MIIYISAGRIDHGHHDSQAKLALNEVVEFNRAVAKAKELTNPGK